MKIKKGILIEKMGKVYVLYDNETSTLHEVNQVTHTILEEIKGGKDKEEIIKSLTRKFDVEQAVARKDFEELISQLEDKGIIV